MKKISVLVTSIFGITLLLAATQVTATKEFNEKEKARDSTVGCKTCHTGFPKKGDEDKKLNDVGKCYQKNKTLPCNK